MTVKQELHDMPFAMLNWHRNWCKKQKMPGFCYRRIGFAEVKCMWNDCPHRELCFAAFINSDASIYKEKK